MRSGPRSISSHHTRFPVCDQSLDNLLGIVQIKDLLGGSNQPRAVPDQGAADHPAVHL